MKKFAVLLIGLLLLPPSFTRAEESTSLTKETLVAALIDPNAESTEFSATRDAAPSNEIEYNAVTLTSSLKIIPKTKNETNRSMYYAIETTFPQIYGRELNTAELAFNQCINKIINEEMQQFKNSVILDTPHRQTLPKEVRNNHFKIDYDIDVIQELGLVSVRFTIQGMQAGRAHPYRAHRVLNFDLMHNKELALSDLFKNDSKYLDAIAKYSSAKLKNSVNDKDQWMIDEGAKATAQNYKNWNIEKKSILITFDEYQVAPYVYGPQEVEIPYSELQNFLSPQAQIISSIKDNTNNLG